MDEHLRCCLFVGFFEEYENKIFENDPFAKLDQKGIGFLMQTALRLGKEANPCCTPAYAASMAVIRPR